MMYGKGGSKMAGLKAMYKSLSPEQKKEMMSAKYGMEKPLMQMGGEGMLDMSVPMQMKMRDGGEMMKKMKAMQMGGEGSNKPLPGNPTPLSELSPRQKRKMIRKAKKGLKKYLKQTGKSSILGGKRYGGGTASTYSGPKKRKK